jgi:hypothetical protein
MNANHLSQARNARFYMLILNGAAMLILSAGQQSAGRRAYCYQ